MTEAVALPDVDDVATAALDEAHGAAAAATGALPPLLRAVETSWTVDLAVQSLAAIRPAFFGSSAPPLFPAPRGFLSKDQEARLAGVHAGFDYVDAQLELARDLGRDLVPAEAPYVLNALSEGRRRRDRPSNPGLVRPGDSAWNVRREHPYGHPPAEHCRSLVAATLAAIPETNARHPVVTGAWLAFSMMSIHPFIDGNGRTGRLLYLLASGPGVPGHLDLGIAEQWVFRRHHYTQALAAGQRGGEAFDVAKLDAAPFARATVTWSTDGAWLRRERVAALARLWDAALGEDDVRAAVVTAALRGFVGPDDLPPTIGEYSRRLAVLEELRAGRVVHRAVLPPSRRPARDVPRPSYRLDDGVLAELGRAVGTGRPGQA